MSNEKNDFEADATLARLKNASPSDANQVDSDRVLVKATRAQNQPSVKYSNFMSKLAQLSRKAKLSLAGFGVSATAAGAALVLTFGAGAASQPLIMLAAGSPNVGAESNRSGLAVGQEASTDKMMLPFFNFEYVAGSEIPDATGKGKIYQLVLDGDPEATMARLATLFDVNGAVKSRTEDYSPGKIYYVGDWESGMSPLQLYWSGTGSWWYNNAAAWVEPACLEYGQLDAGVSDGSSESGSSDGATSGSEGEAMQTCIRWEEQKPTPELLPNKAQIVEQAIRIFSASGLSVSEGDIQIYRDDWSASASASLWVDGYETALQWYLGWSSTGELSYAGGHSVKAVDRGEYDTVSAKTAVERISDGRWYGSPGATVFSDYQNTIGVLSSRSSAASSESVTASEEPAVVPEPAPSDGAVATAEPLPVEPSPIDLAPEQPAEPETVTVEITKATFSMLTVWDASGGAWLVPGFILDYKDQEWGWFQSIISVVEGIIQLPEPFNGEIMPMVTTK